MNQLYHETDDTCRECGQKVSNNNGHIEDYGITCHYECLTESLVTTLKYHFYHDDNTYGI